MCAFKITITPASMGNTYNNWLGRDQFGGDPLFTGSIDELRIWNAAVSPYTNTPTGGQQYYQVQLNP
jgi:hypothetical protein